MLFLERIRAVLALVVFLAALFFAGFTSENLKKVIPDFDRGVLVIGFVIGAGSAARWIAHGSLNKMMIGKKRA